MTPSTRDETTNNTRNSNYNHNAKMSEEDTNSVVLVSKDNFQFVMRKSAVLVSPAIKSMLDKRSTTPPSPAPAPLVPWDGWLIVVGNFVEARENKIYFPNMR